MQLFLTAFESVPDPRAENVRHDLVEILLIAFLAILCGAQHCSEMAEFGRAGAVAELVENQKWRYLRLELKSQNRRLAAARGDNANDDRYSKLAGW